MTYRFIYDSAANTYPRWEKFFTAESGETFSVVLSFSNEIEREQLTAEQVYEHMNNLLQFVRDRSQKISLIGLEGPGPQTEFPFVGDWAEADKALQEIILWWDWAYYNDNFDTGPDLGEEPA